MLNKQGEIRLGVCTYFMCASACTHVCCVLRRRNLERNDTLARGLISLINMQGQLLIIADGWQHVYSQRHDANGLHESGPPCEGLKFVASFAA